MPGKFDNIPTESDTAILFQMEAELNGYDLMYQIWAWCNYIVESFIFSSEDVSDLSDEEIKMLARTSPLIQPDSRITMRRTDSGYVFISFNFKDSEDDSWEDNRTDEERKRDKEIGIRNIGRRNAEVVAKCKKLRNIIS